MNLPTMEQRIAKLLLLIAQDQRRCEACGAELFFVRHRTGKFAPYTADGLNHFIACPEANRFKRRPHAATAQA